MIRALALATCLLAASGVRAQEARPAADIPTISVSETVTRTVPVDSIRVGFRIETEAATFGASKEEADALFERIREHARQRALPELESRYDFLTLSQKPLSLGDRGASMAHQLTLTSQHIAPDRLHASVIELIDAALAIDKRIYVDVVEAYVSSDRITSHREAALAEATGAARASADRLATRMKAGVGRALELEWEFTAPGGRPPGIEALEIGGPSLEVRKRESFEFTRPFPSVITYTALVRASFELTAGAGSLDQGLNPY